MLRIVAAAALALVLAAGLLRAAPVEYEIEAPGPSASLKGALLEPAAVQVPVVLIIPGSGHVDRNGDSPKILKASSYRLLSEALAKRGVATVRIDKRGMFASAAAVADANAVTMDDYAADVHAWVDAVKKTTGAGCVWLLGA